nr:uncharacterized protein LOC102447856 isoform X1 [Pelodiscus sinensis]XP_025044467.1 uncharacterized protein LOC102447856 isoform X1 [Pelodiscus sinensis]XP_025044468.1 uncharacterized protein LOC102447856 isoform X1 [Pelodiscus sinensis]|eukprot:XP_014433017.1 uncharacterized protein LOC102447856 isoform X1 [Pelodiscus sinensis]
MALLWCLWMVIGILAEPGVSQDCTPTPGAQNLALQRTANQSSTYEDNTGISVPARAVDGKRDGYQDQGSCSHTKLDREPWWSVDLGSRYSVSMVIVKNREDKCCWERLKGAQIYVGDSQNYHELNNAICGTITDPTAGSLSTICCNGLEGRYVTIVIPGREEYLSLCEVEVLSQGCTPPPGAQNLALGRPANQSSTLLDKTGQAVPGRAVDGNRDGKFEVGSCSHTTLIREPWWNVDLGRRYSVSMVIVKHGENKCCGVRLKGAEIHVGDSIVNHGKDNPICGTINDTRPGSLSTICCDGLEGRYVTIVIPGRSEYLTLCEVEVLSQGCSQPPWAQNLALGRPATQSSTHKDDTGKAEPGRAVDGNRDGNYKQGSCSLTKLENEPWWNVDLGSRHSVSMVIVKNREDECCWERLKGAQIHVGDSLANHGKDNPLCGTITNIRPGSLSTVCCRGLEGHYVTIVIPDREEYLTLCEVEVLSQGCAPPPGAQNLALRRPAMQSSTIRDFTGEAVSGRAVDGNREGAYDQSSCSHTRFDTEPWWSVDLGSRRSVSLVIVKNREEECCAERLKGAQIHVGNSVANGGRRNPICGTITDPSPGSVNTVCCNGLEGRYVTIVIPGREEFLTLCEVEVLSQGCIPPPGAQNLALGRPANQSSTYNNGTAKAEPGRAVDGNRDGKFELGSCSQSELDTEPWWTVDLGSRHSISMVIVKHREDECCGGKLKGAQIHVGDSLVNQGEDNPLCGTITDHRPGSLSTICCSGLEGRYVTIVIPGKTEHLTLCEVEVLSQGCIPPPGAQNLALGRPATQSSSVEHKTGQAEPGRAVDGNRDGKFELGSCSQTKNDLEPWWSVDLGRRYSVSMVIVKNREDKCCGERLQGAEIRVGDSLVNHGKDNPLCGTITDPSPGSLNSICCNGLEGHFVTIVIPGRMEQLTLCEVEVLSQSCAPPPGAQNLALGCPAIQSSTFEDWTDRSEAGKAVDGKRSGLWEQGSCSQTELDIEPWWTVDLGSRHSVSVVIVKHLEEECCGERLKGAQIHVGDSLVNHGKDNPICGTITNTVPGSLSTVCCNGWQGRYVTITIPGRAEHLTLCEVEVLSQSCAPPPGAQNLALGRLANQSSTFEDETGKAVAGRAVDGKHDGKFEQGSCSLTKLDIEPWWIVDLGRRHSISMVIVKHREDKCCGERLQGAQIRVGVSRMNHGKHNPLCGTITDTRPGSISTICCNRLAGRYVTIVIPDREEYLNLCEVEVLSQGCAPPLMAENLALYRPANQSSTYQNGTEIALAGKAVDGKHDGLWKDGSCSHTNLDTEPWWTVDLGSRHSVSVVIVKHTEDECCGDRLKGAQIHVGDSLVNHGKHNPICGVITATEPGATSTICCNRLEGRYVSIIIPDRAEHLTLCEVEVLSQECAPPLVAAGLSLTPFWGP